MILPDTGSGLYHLIKNDIQNIGYVQNRIRFYMEDPYSFPKCIFMVLSSLFTRRSKRVMDLYAMQLGNVSSLNKKLPEAIYPSRKELINIEKKIDNLYSGLVSRSEEPKILGKQAELANNELMKLSDEYASIPERMKKSNLERKLAKTNHALMMSRDYISNIPREITLLESQRRILQDCISRCEYVLQKSKHIESILTSCLTGIISVSQKRDMMMHIGIAFTNLNEYVSYITNYTAIELINSANSFSNSSFAMDFAIDDSTSNIDALNFIGEFK